MLMAKYTTFLKTLVESGFDIGLNEYPIWNEEYRAVLNKKITDHYWFREIGQETPGLFKFYLNRTMNEIMPYYNQLYETTILEYNPIHNVDYIEEHEISRTHDNTVDNTAEFNGNDTITGLTSVTNHAVTDEDSTGASDVNNKHIRIDTPQNALEITDADSVRFASEISFDKNHSSSEGNITTEQDSETDTNVNTENVTTNTSSGNRRDTGNNTESFLRKLRGNYGVKTTQSMIREERDLIINIDMQIIRDLESCFMNVF